MQKCLGKWEKCGWYINEIMSQKCLHPGRLTWNIQITHLERKMIFQTPMIMFHVNLQGCKICVFWFASLKFKSHIIIFFVEIFFPMSHHLGGCISMHHLCFDFSLLAPDLRIKSWPPKLSLPTLEQLLQTAQGPGGWKRLQERTVGKDGGHWTAQISWAKSWKLLFSNKVIFVSQTIWWNYYWG